MRILADNIGKKFNKEWIFRKLSFDIPSKDHMVLTGPNGSGKSTLLKIISSITEPSEGFVLFNNNTTELDIGVVSFAAPYQNLIEELTLSEHLHFHFTFKKPSLELKEIADRAGLTTAWDKPVADFSSGMKQRLKLALAMYTQSDLLLLDEPTANMDQTGIDWYRNEINEIINTKTIIIASNQRYEYDFLSNVLNISEFSYSRK
ncbi:MAG: ATP-binding cassette domain-containing protein [Cyclobacteriaceae bacterium]